MDTTNVKELADAGALVVLDTSKPVVDPTAVTGTVVGFIQDGEYSAVPTDSPSIVPTDTEVPARV